MLPPRLLASTRSSIVSDGSAVTDRRTAALLTLKTTCVSPCHVQNCLLMEQLQQAARMEGKERALLECQSAQAGWSSPSGLP